MVDECPLGWGALQWPRLFYLQTGAGRSLSSLLWSQQCPPPSVSQSFLRHSERRCTEKKYFLNVLEFLYLFTINPIFPQIKLKPDIGILRTEHKSDNAPLKWSPAIGSVVEAFVDVKHTYNHGLILWAILSSLVVQFIYSNLPNESKRIGPLASEDDSGHTVTIFGGKGYQETYKTPQYSMVANIKSLTTNSLLDLPLEAGLSEIRSRTPPQS